MRVRTLLAGAAVSAVLVGGLVPTAAAATPPPPTGPTLRSLGAAVGLPIGTAAIPYDLGTEGYRQLTAKQFSVLTPGNEMKWQVVEPRRGVYDWSGADRLVAFAEQHGQRVRGHTLLWHSQLPTWLETGADQGTISRAQLRNLLYEHITTEVSRYRGRVWQWDVANEFFADASPSGIKPDDFWIRHLGPGVIDDAFRWAHAADPNAVLFYNDYNIAGEDGTNAKADAVYRWVRAKVAQGVPIMGVGDQGHLDTRYGYPSRMTADLQRYKDLGLQVAITEADVRTDVDNATDQNPTNPLAPSAQAAMYDGMLQSCLTVGCLSFTVWGFGDADSWVPSTFAGEGYAGIFTVGLRPKESYYALQRTLRTVVSHHQSSGVVTSG